jgi:hypothetical protein
VPSNIPVNNTVYNSFKSFGCWLNNIMKFSARVIKLNSRSDAVWMDEIWFMARALSTYNYSPVEQWCRETLNIPCSASTIIKFGSHYTWDAHGGYVDDLWVIAK